MVTGHFRTSPGLAENMGSPPAMMSSTPAACRPGRVSGTQLKNELRANGGAFGGCGVRVTENRPSRVQSAYRAIETEFALIH